MSDPVLTPDVEGGLTILNGTRDCQFVDIDVELLAQSVCSVKSLVFESENRSSFAQVLND
jgi:hypothetical protein